MYTITDAHPITIFALSSLMMFVSFFIVSMYASAGFLRKGIIISSIITVWGGFMFWFCLSNYVSKIEPPFGSLITPLSWIIPSLIIYIKRDWFLEASISQKWLTGIQIFRIEGGVFLIEMIGGNVPAIFAYPAGIGDVIVGCSALVGLIYFRNRNNLPNQFIIFIIVIGIIDLMSAFFFGFTSSSTSPLQLFFPPEKSTLILFPTGMIPLFFVPIAIAFHTLSWLNFRKYDSK